MKKIRIIRILLIILIIIWAHFVFDLSNQTGEKSSGLSRKITALFIHDEEKIELVEPYVRKLAHFSEYAIGGGLFILLFSTYEWKEKNKILNSILMGVWYAIIDEAHQLLVSERSGSIKDVWIDSLGVMVGVFVILFMLKLFSKFKKNKGEKIEE